MNLTELQTGLFPGIAIEDYHDWEKHPAVSSSMHRTMLDKTPHHVKAGMNGETGKDTPALLFGEISHNILLSNEISNYELIPPSIPRRDKRIKAYTEFLEQCEKDGKYPLREQDLELLIKMHDALMANDIARNIIEGMNGNEISGFWQPRGHKFWSKLRMDIQCDAFELFADYKTTRDASPEAFSRHFFSYGYDVQAAHYTNGLLNITGRDYKCIYIAQEKDPPYAVACYLVDSKVIQDANVKIEYASKLFDQCFEKDEWPSYKPLTDIIHMGWAAGEAESYKFRLEAMGDGKD